VRVDLKASVLRMRAESPRELRFTLRAGEKEATARPSELLTELFGQDWAKPGVARIVREDVSFDAPAE
jgi:hypothetical protein